MFGNSGFTPQDWQQMALMGGLSILANNDGRMSNGQLIANGGLDALAGLQARKQYEAAMARQQMQDEQAQQAHDLQMRRGQMEMDEAARRAELMQRWMNGDQSVYKYLFPLQYLQDQRQARDHAHALKVAAMNEAKNGSKYVDGVGMVDKNGVVTPLTDPSGQPYMTPKERKEQVTADKQARALENQKSLALQTAATQLTSINNALKLAREGNAYKTTGIVGSIGSYIPGSEARNLRAELDTIGAGAMIQTMMQLKAASPTGATGMGALNKEEGQALRDSLGSLDTWQDPVQLRRNLNNIKSVYTNMLLSWGYTPEEVAGLFGGTDDNNTMEQDADALIAKARGGR